MEQKPISVDPAAPDGLLRPCLPVQRQPEVVFQAVNPDTITNQQVHSTESNVQVELDEGSQPVSRDPINDNCAHLIDQFRRGDTDVLWEIAALFRPALVDRARKYCVGSLDRISPEDLAQQAILRIVETVRRVLIHNAENPDSPKELPVPRVQYFFAALRSCANDANKSAEMRYSRLPYISGYDGGDELDRVLDPGDSISKVDDRLTAASVRESILEFLKNRYMSSRDDEETARVKAERAVSMIFEYAAMLAGLSEDTSETIARRYRTNPDALKAKVFRLRQVLGMAVAAHSIRLPEGLLDIETMANFRELYNRRKA